jgi:uncharacterized protein
MDGRTILPLLVQQGKDIVLEYLNYCIEYKSKNEILYNFPDHLLFDALLNHGILQQQSFGQIAKDLNCFNSNCDFKLMNNKKDKLTIYILLTQYCNLKCIYCLNGDETYRKNKLLMMDDYVAFKAVERGFDLLSSDGTLEIVFFGGEPLLNWSLAKKIIIFSESLILNKFPGKQCKYHLTTNLTIFPDDLLDYVSNYDISFLIDIDGPEELHNFTRPAINKEINSFHKTTNNIKRLVDHGIKPQLRATVTSNNVNYLLEITKLHKDLGGISSAFVPLNPVNSDEIILPNEMYPNIIDFSNNLREVLESDIWDIDEKYPLNDYMARIQKRERINIACGAPYGNTLTIDVNGNVYPCIYLVGIERYFAGNVFDKNFPDGEVFETMMNYLDVRKNDNCRGCSYRFLCAGGCPVGRLTVENNPNVSAEALAYSKGIKCAMSKTIIDHILWSLADNCITSFEDDMNVKIGDTIKCC